MRLADKNLAYLNGLPESIKKTITTLKSQGVPKDLEGLYETKINLLVKLVDFSAKIYKDAQFIIKNIDDRVQMEFSYFARAQNTMVRLTSAKEIDWYFAVDDALTAARHLLNDIVDLVVDHLSIETDRLDTMSRYLTLSNVCNDYDEIADLLIEIKGRISETRDVRGVLRVYEYVTLIDDGSFQKLLGFSKKLKKYERDLKREIWIKVRLEGMKVVVPTLAFVALLVFGIMQNWNFFDKKTPSQNITNPTN